MCTLENQKHLLVPHLRLFPQVHAERDLSACYVLIYQQNAFQQTKSPANQSSPTPSSQGLSLATRRPCLLLSSPVACMVAPAPAKVSKHFWPPCCQLQGKTDGTKLKRIVLEHTISDSCLTLLLGNTCFEPAIPVKSMFLPTTVKCTRGEKHYKIKC